MNDIINYNHEREAFEAWWKLDAEGSENKAAAFEGWKARAAFAQDALPEVQRLREALENSRRAMFAVLKQETSLKAVAKRVLASEIERIDNLAASTGQEVQS